MTVHKLPAIRNAGKHDARALARLIDIAGEGIPSWLWGQQCRPGQVPLDVGSERARRETGGFSFTNSLLAVSGDQVLGMVLSYPIVAAPEDDPDDLPAPIAPFVELERHSVGTWYINALAVFPGHRGKGIGAGLLAAAEARAARSGYPRTSIQVYVQNTGAVRLYKRMGYAVTASAAVRRHPCPPYYTGEVLLLTKPV